MVWTTQPNVPALAIDQPAIGLDVLRSQATELGASSFNVVPELPELSTITLGPFKIHSTSLTQFVSSRTDFQTINYNEYDHKKVSRENINAVMPL
jgi:hypothetical protein